MAHADWAAVGFQQAGVIAGGILAAAIGMMHQPRRRLPQFQRHPQGGQRKIVFQADVQCPTNHAARKSIDHHRQVHKLALQANVGDIGHPQLVDASQRHLPGQVGVHFPVVVGIRSHHELPLPHTQ